MKNFLDDISLAEEERDKRKLTWEAHEKKLIDGLMVAIIEQAVVDYERALCSGDERVIKSIEGNAKRGDIDFTEIPLSAILSRVRTAKKRFDNISVRHEREIEEASQRLRVTTSHNRFDEDSPYRCPLCGGGMYMMHHRWGARVQCTRCHLFTWIERVVDGKAVRAR